jgi:hypothetical protein
MSPTSGRDWRQAAMSSGCAPDRRRFLERVGSGEGRRAEATDPEWVRRRAEERAPLFEMTASQVVDVDEASPGEIADRILAEL